MDPATVPRDVLQLVVELTREGGAFTPDLPGDLHSKFGRSAIEKAERLCLVRRVPGSAIDIEDRLMLTQAGVALAARILLRDAR